MVRRRKVNNMLGLAVLAALAERPMHPYEMAAVLRERGKDEDMPIKWGTLYTVVRNLEKYGFITVSESVRDGSHPERTIYQITREGRVEFADWVRDLLAEPQREQPKFMAALSVWQVLGPEEAMRLLRQRLTLLDAEVADRRTTLMGYAGDLPRIFLVESEYGLAMREAEAAWIRSLLDELTTGSFPDLGAWREWYETGRLPSEVRSPTERGEQSD
ncbi:PadR family transcriptional regulator [Spongiactinospora gelatinilytica]|uniref:PadR family transcriptional regulator n=1 Tax=Spongiactinospora gelatinilytica TaxID=2666298 RepID=A0A2W2ICD4_9ACTN|nr:PadR family transcriptional regulator [Spongiactinospora gelatinilytica]PZG55777.1 PadR family transcriptional regulator [Spongiactinospora gelatinilytica]